MRMIGYTPKIERENYF